MLADFEREGREGTRAMPTMGPRFFYSHPRHRHDLSSLSTRGVEDLYSNLDPHGTSLFT